MGGPDTSHRGRYTRVNSRPPNLQLGNRHSSESSASASARLASVGIGSSTMNHSPRTGTTPAPDSEAAEEPRTFDPPSFGISPLRRMAPQRGTTSVPAREEPLLSDPRRPRKAYDKAFVSSQTQRLPLYSGRPWDEQDQFLERMCPIPRDILPFFRH